MRLDLNSIKILEVYAAYDEPCLYSCKTSDGQLYLVVFIDQTEDSKTWLYAPLSMARLKQLINKTLGLRQAFAETESGIAFIVTEYQRVISKWRVACSELPDKYLPLPGVFLLDGD